ncbi:TldD/PmbA family protein [Egbenema bharatensis]|uniref:TldD/PmbA family protein n=1 Tax=Egbenema bharatensis TaxID=3463334 RepID=UPI003A8AD9A9
MDSLSLETTFDRLVTALLDELHEDEYLTLRLLGEQSQFVRFNQAKVRQAGCVSDAEVRLTFMQNQRTSSFAFPVTGNWETDWNRGRSALSDLREEVAQLPADPYLVLPEGDATSRDVHTGALLPPEAVVDAILPSVADLDFTGFYAAGSLVRGYADSIGQKHWFATESFALDYSLFTEAGQAVKSTFAGSQWDQSTYTAKLALARQQLEQLIQSPKVIPRGQYRTYLAPAAVSELLQMFSWGGLSESSLRRGGSALRLLQQGEKRLSTAFHLTENFQRGLVPRFNEWGEVAPVKLPLIQAGQLANTLINSRTAKEYNLTPNGANIRESLRSPEIAPGDLPQSDVLRALDRGLYVSNLHYLNWSDRPTGRVTGMTRYACFWVEDGEIVAPIQNLRFDESLYRYFGENLIALTDFQEFIPEVGTYDHRDLGGSWVPGALVEAFTYTL